jgi:hypothetical protein
MAFNINDFYSSLQFGGARPALFDVLITWPGGILPEIQFMCRATTIPSATLNIVEQTYFGRALKFAGNRTFEDWNVTIINDEDYLIRKGMEDWSESLNSFEGNVRDSGRLNTFDYKGTGTVTHYGKTGNVIRRYEVRGLVPASVAAMPMDWSTDEIQTFDVTFAMDYWQTIGNTVADTLQIRPSILNGDT